MNQKMTGLVGFYELAGIRIELWAESKEPRVNREALKYHFIAKAMRIKVQDKSLYRSQKIATDFYPSETGTNWYPWLMEEMEAILKRVQKATGRKASKAEQERFVEAFVHGELWGENAFSRYLLSWRDRSAEQEDVARRDWHYRRD